jgi:plastocyanin
MARPITRAIATSFVLLIVGCQAEKPVGSAQIDRPTGRISGVVTLGYLNIPAPTIITNSKDPQACGSRVSKLDLLVSEESRGIANVVVWLADVDLPTGYHPRQQDLRLVAQRCQFSPHVGALTVGSTIQVRNADLIGHSAQLSGALDDKSQLSSQGDEVRLEARAIGIIRVQCADHEWMEAFVRVDPHPFHAVTDSEGEFTIDAVPIGTYRLGVWHERFGEQEREVAVRPGEVSRIELRCPAPGSP